MWTKTILGASLTLLVVLVVGAQKSKISVSPVTLGDISGEFGHPGYPASGIAVAVAGSGPTNTSGPSNRYIVGCDSSSVIVEQRATKGSTSYFGIGSGSGATYICGYEIANGNYPTTVQLGYGNISMVNKITNCDVGSGKPAALTPIFHLQPGQTVVVGGGLGILFVVPQPYSVCVIASTDVDTTIGTATFGTRISYATF